MNFIGVDLAWGTKGKTGICLVQSNKVVASKTLQAYDEIVQWLRPHVQSSCIIAIDAPLIIRNLKGRRWCETVISQCFGKYEAAAHSSNLSMQAFRNGIRGALLAQDLDLGMDPRFEFGAPVRAAIEVYPHPALVALFSLPKSLKYKRKSRRTAQQRLEAFKKLVDLLGTLAKCDPPLDVTTSPRWESLLRKLVSSHVPLDSLEDELDAYVCAYIAMTYWAHGLRKCRVVGTVDNGYIITPVTKEQGACIDKITSEPRDTASVPSNVASAGRTTPRQPATGGGQGP